MTAPEKPEGQNVGDGSQNVDDGSHKVNDDSHRVNDDSHTVDDDSHTVDDDSTLPRVKSFIRVPRVHPPVSTDRGPTEDESSHIIKKDGHQVKRSPEVLVRYCDECHNLMRPREDKTNNKLLLACRSCGHTKDAPPGACIMRDYVQPSVIDTAAVMPMPDFAEDPTLPHIKTTCPICSGPDAVYFHSHQVVHEDEIRIYNACTSCGHVWRQDPPSLG